MTCMWIEVPKEEERPRRKAEEEIDADSLVESGIEEVSMLHEVDNRLRDKEDAKEDDSQIKEASNVGLVEC